MALELRMPFTLFKGKEEKRKPKNMLQRSDKTHKMDIIYSLALYRKKFADLGNNPSCSGIAFLEVSTSGPLRWGTTETKALRERRDAGLHQRGHHGNVADDGEGWFPMLVRRPWQANDRLRTVHGQPQTKRTSPKASMAARQIPIFCSLWVDCRNSALDSDYKVHRATEETKATALTVPCTRSGVRQGMILGHGCGPPDR